MHVERKNLVMLVPVLHMCITLISIDNVEANFTQYVTLKPNDEAVMVCPFQVPSIPIIWLGPGEGKLTTYSDGKTINHQISSYKRIQVTGDHTKGEYILHVLNVTKGDAGRYACNSIQNGKPLLANFYLDILEKPRTDLNKMIFKFQTKIGTPAKVKVPIITSQEPIISWTQTVGGRLGQWTVSNHGISMFLLTSTISATTKNHFGTYGIKVRNDVGSIDLKIKLELIDYLVTIKPDAVYCNASTQITLFCQLHVEVISGWQNTWTHSRNDNFIKTVYGSVVSNTSSVEIKFCDYREEGDYKCTWINSLKEYSTSLTVTSNGPPTITEKVNYATSRGLCMAVHFYSPRENVSVRWFRNDKLIESTTRLMITLSSKIVRLNYSEKIIKEKGFLSKLCDSNFTSIDILPYSCEILNPYGRVEYTFSEDLLNKTYNEFLLDNTPIIEDRRFVGILMRILVIGGGVLLVTAIMVIIVTFTVVCLHKRCRKKELAGENVDEIRHSDVPDEPEYLLPVSEYEEIDDTQMSDINNGNFVQANMVEQETTEVLLEDQNGTSLGTNAYQDIAESQFEVHIYKEFEQ